MVQVTFQGNPVNLIGDEIKVGDPAPNFTVLSQNLQQRSLNDYKGKLKLISVVPSLDTGVCSAQTKRFNEEINAYPNVELLTVSMDLPFAQGRWCQTEGVTNTETLSDHREGDFGKNYGVLIEHLRLLSRAVFVVDENNQVTYVEYVKEVTDHPDYDKVLDHLRTLQ